MIAAILSLLASGALQTAPASPPPAPTAAPIPAEASGDPDILISVRARADQVRWRQVGSVTVRAWSEPGGNVIEENLSTGLPRPIPGQRTFRDVEWNLLAGACVSPGRIILESGADAPDRRCERPTQTPTQNGDTHR